MSWSGGLLSKVIGLAINSNTITKISRIAERELKTATIPTTNSPLSVHFKWFVYLSCFKQPACMRIDWMQTFSMGERFMQINRITLDYRLQQIRFFLSSSMHIRFTFNSYDYYASKCDQDFYLKCTQKLRKKYLSIIHCFKNETWRSVSFCSEQLINIATCIAERKRTLIVFSSWRCVHFMHGMLLFRLLS